MIKDVFLVSYFGTSSITDIYIISITIPTLFFSFFLSAIKSSFIPKYINISSNESDENAKIFSSKIINITIFLIFLIISIVLFFTKEFVLLIAPGFDSEQINYAIIFTQISIFSLIFATLVALFSALLNIKNIFLIPPLTAIPMQIGIIFSIMLAANYNILFLPFGYLFSSFIQFFLLVFLLKKISYSHIWKFGFNDKDVKNFIFTILPIFISVAISDLSKIVDKALASFFNIGAISTLDYAHKLTGIIESIVVMAILTAYFPSFAKAAQSNSVGFKKAFREATLLILTLAIPGTIGVIIFSNQIVDLVYGYGNFDFESVKVTSEILAYYAPTIIFFSIRSLLIRSFYSFGNTSIVMYSTIISVIINLSLNFLLFYFTDFGVNGLAISSSIASFISLLFLFVMINKKIPKILDEITFKEIFKIILSTALMALFLFIFKNSSITISKISSLFAVFLSMLIFVLSLFIFKFNLIYGLIRRFKKI
jgi:putative peptidoglycan lipid II flippase